MKNASNALGGILRNLGMEGALGFGRIAGNWSTLFDGPLSVHTSPEALSGNTLTVVVDTPAWLHQTNFFKSKMISALSSFGVKNIRFRLGRVRRDERPVTPPSAPTPDPTAAQIEEVNQMLTAIVDAELRESIRLAALKSVAHQSKRKGKHTGHNQ